MLFKERLEDIVGIDIGSSSIKLTRLDKSGVKPRLLNFAVMPLEADAIVDGSVINRMAVVDAVRALVETEQIKTRNCCVGVSGHSVIAKKIAVPVMTETELEEAIGFEAEQYIPDDVADVNIDFQILRTPDLASAGENDQMEVLLVAVKKDTIQDHISLIVEAGLSPRVVDLDALAIENIFDLNYPEGIQPEEESGGESDEGEGGERKSQIVALVNIGAEIININIVADGVTSYIRDMSNYGGNRYTQALQKELSIGAQQAEALKLGVDLAGFSPVKISPIIQSVTEEIGREINKSFEFYRTNFGEEDIHKVILSGGCARIPGIDRFLGEMLYIDVEVANPFGNVEVSSKVFDPDYIEAMAPAAAVSVGLALREFGDR